MSRLPFVLASSVALVILPAAVADDQPAPLKFAWPVPCKATVTEKLVKRGQTATTRYTISIEKQDADFKLHIDDFSFTEFAGKAPDDPSVAATVAVALPTARLIPDLLIDADGRVKDVLGLDAMIEAEVALLSPGADETVRAARYKQLSTPEARAAIKRESTKNWRAWAGDWVGLVIPAGKDVASKYPVRDIDGTEIDAPAILQRTAADEAPGHVRLTRVATLEGEATKASLDLWIKLMTKQTGKAPPEGLITGLTLSTRTQLVAEETTLRPKGGIREEKCVVHRKEKDDLVVGIESHEFAFEWAKPAGDK
jgi:hypothetical protein